MIGQDIIDDRQAAMDAYDVLPAEVRAAIAESPYPWSPFGLGRCMLEDGHTPAEFAAMIRRADRRLADAHDALPVEVRAAIAESPFPWGPFGVVGAMLQRGCAPADVAAMIRRADKATLGIRAGRADSRQSPSSATDGSPCPGAGATAGGAAYRRDRR